MPDEKQHFKVKKEWTHWGKQSNNDLLSVEKNKFYMSKMVGNQSNPAMLNEKRWRCGTGPKSCKWPMITKIVLSSMFYATQIIRTLYAHWLRCIMDAFITRGRRKRASITSRACPSPSHSFKESLEASKTELSSYQSSRTGRLCNRMLHWSHYVLDPTECKSSTDAEVESYLVMDIWRRSRSLLVPCGRFTSVDDERLPNWHLYSNVYVAARWLNLKLLAVFLWYVFFKSSVEMTSDVIFSLFLSVWYFYRPFI